MNCSIVYNGPYTCTYTNVPIILVKVIKWILNFLLTLSSGKERGVQFLKNPISSFFFNSSFLLGPVNGQRYKLFQQTIKTWDNKVSIKLATAYRPDVLTLNYNYWYKNHSYNFYSNIWTYNNVHCILYDQ